MNIKMPDGKRIYCLFAVLSVGGFALSFSIIMRGKDNKDWGFLFIRLSSFCMCSYCTLDLH